MKWRPCIPPALWLLVLKLVTTESKGTCPTKQNLQDMNTEKDDPAILAASDDDQNSSCGPWNSMNVDGESLSLGGGAINEKPRMYGSKQSEQRNYYSRNGDSGGSIIDTTTWDPINNLSHMLHAMVGLERYPNYLSRFRDTSDIDLLERHLKHGCKTFEVRNHLLWNGGGA